ncbi:MULTISPECIES: hypothetical protein [unclassified Solwaraspora]|uniref:hypothetical protein n=1 Tax=unclassified Solwaraspora TaxID=2627926 RepID=UPI00259B9E2C|nr:hypothetical protein [Solwaraspora sp. WMMA2056]WJK42091.1 hypothetical protein O7608_06780 [Solwaraspora sp. WMMA2056]
MTLADVVAQLRTAVERLDQAAVGAARAQADLDQAHQHLTTAGTGSNHNEIRDAITEAETAAAKAGRLGNLLAKSAEAFSRCGNCLIPGSMPTLQANPDTSLPAAKRSSPAPDARRAGTDGSPRRVSRMPRPPAT